MAEPFISPLGLTICAPSVLRRDPAAIQATHHTSIVLEVQVHAIRSPPGLALSDDNGGHDLLPELRLSLLDGRHDHVANTGSRQTVQARTDALDGDDVQVAGARVVAAVHDGSAAGELAQTLHRMRRGGTGESRRRRGTAYLRRQ